MRRNRHIAFLLLLGFWSVGFAQIGTIAVGARALSFAGNHTAVANDLSAVYWNPAALAYLPVREFFVSFDGMRTYGKTDGVTGSRVTVEPDAKMSDHRDSIRLNGAGAMTAIPTVQGGLTIAGAYERPFAFDDLSVYSYDIGNTSVSELNIRYGDINRWSGAFGVQVAEKVAAGLTISLITGSESAVFDQQRNGKPYNDLEISHNYIGYSLSGGALYLPMDYLKIGFKINAMMDLSVVEKWNIKFNYIPDDDEVYDWRGAKQPGPYNGRAYTAPNGSVGAAVTLPWITAALDIRATMPYTFILPGEKIPEDMQARDFKLGAGVGFEVPLPVAPVVLRGGYSFDEYDLCPVVHKMEDSDIMWEEMEGFTVDRNKHTLAAGAGIFTSGVGIELSYNYQTWGISHKNTDRTLKQTFSNHRVMTAVIFRY